MTNNQNKEIFSKNLLYYIEMSGQTQREIAEAINVSSSTFNEWATGRKYPRMDKIEKLAAYFQIQKSSIIDRFIVNDDEKLLLSLYRQFPKEIQNIYIDLFKAILENYKLILLYIP